MGIKYNVKTIAFCCIATGIFGFDQTQAAKIALDTVKEWLKVNHAYIDKIIFCTYTTEDFRIYNEKLANNVITDNPVTENARNKINLLKELNVQKSRDVNAEQKRKQKELLKKEIDATKSEISTSNKNKRK